LAEIGTETDLFGLVVSAGMPAFGPTTIGSNFKLYFSGWGGGSAGNIATYVFRTFLTSYFAPN